jgi:MoaA/NifB/PqqE/SkfB family radical SAM enzyme
MKRADIKTGFLCNNNCIFCVQADNKLSGNRTFDDIKNDLIDTRKRCQEVVLTGGEVTINKDFFKILQVAKKLNFLNIQIQTNGRIFSSLEFSKKVIELGVTEFVFAIHGYSAKQHDSLTMVKGSFKQSIEGIKNIILLNGRVLINCVVVKENYKDLEKIAELLISLKVNQIQFAFVHAMGNAWINYDKVVPKMSEVVPFIKKSIDIAIKNNIFITTEAIPFCLMKGYENHIAENYIPNSEIRGKDFQNTNDFTYLRKNHAKIKFSQCKECKYDNICEGPWKDYPEKMGSSEFKPVK